MATLRTSDTRGRPWTTLWPPAFGDRSRRTESRHGGEELPIAT